MPPAGTVMLGWNSNPVAFTAGLNVGDPCDAASNSTVDGAFASYFSQVAPFLDPPPPSCGGAGASCNVAADCCSNNCKGPLGRKTCK
jgi:hypothetical protein